MRLRDDIRPTKANRSTSHPPIRFFNRGTEEETECRKRWIEHSEMGQRLYSNTSIMRSPLWRGFNDGFPSREASRLHPWGQSIRILESGEIELRDPCGGSPSSLHIRQQLNRMTNGTIEVTTWGQRPVMYTKDGTKLTKRDYRPLARYCAPHQIHRDKTICCPTVMVDHDLSVAAPLLIGEDGMFAYWPDERSYPVTWSSWLVTIENVEVCKVMASALRRVCKYANAVNAMMLGTNLDDAQRNVALKEAERVSSEWKTATKMLGYLVKSRDPKTVAQMIMDDHTSRQIVVLAASLSDEMSASHIHGLDFQIRKWSGIHGVNRELRFTRASPLFQMLKEQTSEQYETKFLYTRPPEYRANWELVEPRPSLYQPDGR